MHSSKSEGKERKCSTDTRNCQGEPDGSESTTRRVTPGFMLLSKCLKEKLPKCEEWGTPQPKFTFSCKVKNSQQVLSISYSFLMDLLELLKKPQNTSILNLKKSDQGVQNQYKFQILINTHEKLQDLLENIFKLMSLLYTWVRVILILNFYFVLNSVPDIKN